MGVWGLGTKLPEELVRHCLPVGCGQADAGAKFGSGVRWRARAPLRDCRHNSLSEPVLGVIGGCIGLGVGTVGTWG